MGSLATAGSFVAGGFCLDKFPVPVTGPEFLLRKGSAGTQPLGGGLPSSPPSRYFIVEICKQQDITMQELKTNQNNINNYQGAYQYLLEP